MSCLVPSSVSVFQQLTCHFCTGALLAPTVCCVYLYCKLLEEWSCLCAESNATKAAQFIKQKNECGRKVSGKTKMQYLGQVFFAEKL